MKIGILVNTDLRLDDVVGITRAAAGKGHSVDIFAMDEGVRLLCEPDFWGLCALEGVHMSYCDHSTDQLRCKQNDLPGEIVCGSQYDNALMGHAADRIIVL